jgi:hypothetical protein
LLSLRAFSLTRNSLSNITRSMEVGNMEVKLFEVRDRGTFLPVMVTKFRANTEAEAFILHRAGGLGSPEAFSTFFLELNSLENGSADPYIHPSDTRKIAHQYIEQHWDQLSTGDVIDVEYITGQTDATKVSERFGYPYGY